MGSLRRNVPFITDKLNNMLSEITLQIIIFYALAGIFAGLIGGMVGLSGGVIIVPVLHFLFIKQGFPPSLLMQLAVTTSLATIIITSSSATYVHHKKGAVLWATVRRLAPGLLIGACLGAMLADSVSSTVLRMTFGVFEILVAIQIWMNFKPQAHAALPGTPGLVGSGVGIGLLSTLMGIGGGTLTVPFLLWCNVNIRNAVAVSSACGFPIAIAATIALIIVGWDEQEVPMHSLGYLYWPAALIISAMTLFSAPLGARLAHYLPIPTLKRVFAIVLVIVGLRMLLH
jgi:uncharacterized protein